MRIPRLRWNRTHNLLTITVSFGRVWHRVPVGDALVLGYNATGRLARILVLDPAALLPADADERVALATVRTLCAGSLRVEDLAVLDSAIERAQPTKI